MKVFALLVEVVEVGCDRLGAGWLLHFGAARVDPLATTVPWMSRAWRAALHALDMIMLINAL